MKTHFKVLERLADQRFHSGPALARDLGLSRAAVWKAIRRLGEIDIDIHAVPGRGYRLADPIELFDRQRVLAAIGDHARSLLAELEVHREIASTNRHLMARAAAGDATGQVCLADSQSAGRGRRGRDWHSPFGRNIYLSLLWRFAEGPARLAGLSIAVGVVIADLLRELGIDGVALKWPNDVLLGGRKLAGILLESTGEADGPCHVVVGIGVNVGMTAHDAAVIDQPWADLGDVHGTAGMSRNRLAGQLIDRLLPAVEAFAETGLEPYRQRWLDLDAHVGCEVELRMASQAIRGIHAGIDHSGGLLLELDGAVRSFHGGELSLRGTT